MYFKWEHGKAARWKVAIWFSISVSVRAYEFAQNENNINKKCIRRVRPTRYAPASL